MKENRHPSNQWKFAKELSIRTKAQVITFKSKCHLLEEFLFDRGVTINKFSFHGTDYNSYLHLEMKFEDYEILHKSRWEFYRFLHKHLPINFREIDWMGDKFIHQSISRISQWKDDKKTSLRLVLDYQQHDVEYPSHDFICMSEDVMNANKATEIAH